MTSPWRSDVISQIYHPCAPTKTSFELCYLSMMLRLLMHWWFTEVLHTTCLIKRISVNPVSLHFNAMLFVLWLTSVIIHSAEESTSVLKSVSYLVLLLKSDIRDIISGDQIVWLSSKYFRWPKDIKYPIWNKPFYLAWTAENSAMHWALYVPGLQLDCHAEAWIITKKYSDLGHHFIKLPDACPWRRTHDVMFLRFKPPTQYFLSVEAHRGHAGVSYMLSCRWRCVPTLGSGESDEQTLL